MFHTCEAHEVIEMLECAKINCQNILKGGDTFIEITKTQIQIAIDMLEEDIAKSLECEEGK